MLTDGIWIHGIESKNNEKIDDVLQKVKEWHELVQVIFVQKDIVCAHRTGMEYVEKNSGTKVKSIIMKYSSHRGCKNNFMLLNQKVSQIVKRN